MFKHVTVDRARRALLGAAGMLILQTALQPTTALGQTSSGSKMKIGIIGAGHIGGTIGELWAKAGQTPRQLQLDSLRRLAESGRVSATRTDTGDYQIDPAELYRVFPLGTGQGRPPNKTQRPYWLKLAAGANRQSATNGRAAPQRTRAPEQSG